MFETQRGISLKDVQAVNRSVILKAIHDRGICSRKEISTETGLDQATITRAIASLIDDGVVKEVSLIKGTRGRRSIGLSFDDSRFRLLTVRLQRLSFSVALFDFLGNILDFSDTAFPKQQDPERTFDAIMGTVGGYLEEHGENLIGIGVALPGPFLEKDQRIILMTESSNWQSFDLVGELQSKCPGIPIFSNHDAKAAALATWREQGISSGSEVMLYVSGGQGVGSALVINGHVFKGSQGIAGEVGHMSIDLNGPPCKCGNRGCLELYTSRLTLMRSVQEKTKGNSETSLTDDCSFADLVHAYRAGDILASTEVERVAHYLGQGLVNCINLLNPDLIVLGDEYAAFGEPFLAVLDQHIRTFVLPSIYRYVRLQLANIENDLVLKGCFLNVMNHTILAS